MAARLEEKPDETALQYAGNALAALISEETAQKGALTQILKDNEQSRGKMKSLKKDEKKRRRSAGEMGCPQRFDWFGGWL